MSERTSYKPGTPCWIDLGTPDQDAAGEFYGNLFGWSVEEDENTEATGGYRVAMLRDKAIGGVMKLMQEGQPPAWSSYVAVDDVDAAVARATDAGGSAIAEPMDVLDYGRMAFIADPSGAVLGLWKGGRNIGAGLVNEPGALAWNELNTRDVARAKDFYGAVFEWTFDQQGSYTRVLLDGEPVAGILDMAEQGVPAEVPAHWLVYFAVDDTDATVEKTKGGGGGLIVEPFDTPIGRIAILHDSFRASFGVIALSEEARENAP